MKKRILSTLVALSFVASSSVVFAAGAALTSGNTTAVTTGPTVYAAADSTTAADSTKASVLGRLSKGVNIGVKFDTTGYALTTKHNGGTNMYGTAYDSTSMYMQPGNPTLAAPSASDATSFGSGWTAM